VGPVAILDGAENLAPNGVRSPDRPTSSESLYRPSKLSLLDLVNRTKLQLQFRTVNHVPYVQETYPCSCDCQGLVRNLHDTCIGSVYIPFSGWIRHLLGNTDYSRCIPVPILQTGTDYNGENE
jgi:hypothetical protein